jgi:nicotinamide riboside kinase
MTTVINLFGGSGIGKSTTAAHLFAEMKYRGVHCELVREYVKQWAWQKKKVGPFDQMYLLGKQSKYESMLYGQVDYIITDSPLLLCPIYERYYSGKDLIAPAAVNFLDDAKSKGVTHLNFLLKRNKEFDPRGRYETAEQAIKVDGVVKTYLEEHNIPFYELSVSDRTRVDEILNIVFNTPNATENGLLV